jgi:hypothetical protein
MPNLNFTGTKHMLDMLFVCGGGQWQVDSFNSWIIGIKTSKHVASAFKKKLKDLPFPSPI